MAQERKGAVTFKGNPLTLIGPELKAGQKAPDFQVLAGDLSVVGLKNSAGKIRLISVVPSLDTPICDQQTRKFNEEAANFPGNIEILTISADLPFAQGRYCAAAGIKKVKTLSDHRDVSFGQNWGVLIKELRILSRAVFVVDAQDTIQYAEYVKEIATHPNYQAALDALKQKAGK